MPMSRRNIEPKAESRKQSDVSHRLRSLPSVDRVLVEPTMREMADHWSHDHVVNAIREALHNTRSQLLSGAGVSVSAEQIAETAASDLEGRLRPSLRHVINATGVVIHTNLGRAPISDASAHAMVQAAIGYSNLEFDLTDGRRGSRADHLESLLQALTDAESGIAVNNNAAALYLAMSAHCAGREVIVSRGQAVEIGGGFRIPDVLRDAGAELVEVGTTNRTRVSDYANAITERTAAILRVHSSNFKIVGFTEEPSVGELSALAEQHDVMLIDDVGSGCLLDTRQFGLAHEPRPQDSIAAGADLVLFSGDKLLGGPQAGVIIGRRSAVEPLRSHPLMRVLRMDKATIAGLSATLQHYLADEAVAAIPIWRMIAASPNELRSRAEAWQHAVGAGSVDAAESAIGGGSLPAETRSTFVWSIAHPHPSEAAAQLRANDPPIVARVERDRLILDPRTVLPSEDELVVEALRQMLQTRPANGVSV